jgi:hypothetical protein
VIFSLSATFGRSSVNLATIRPSSGHLYGWYVGADRDCKPAPGWAKGRRADFAAKCG